MNAISQSTVVNSSPANPLLATSIYEEHTTTHKTLVNAFLARPFTKQKNYLLAAIQDDKWSQLEPFIEEVDLSVNQVLCESGKMPAYLYFPTTAVVSLLYMTENGSSSEVAVIGNDGVVGISYILSGSTSPNQAQVNSAGKGFRIRAQVAKNAISKDSNMLNILLCYLQSMMTQMTQTAVCNRHHTIDQLLCRRLLLSLDRLASNQIAITQEMLASMLGVRRESVTDAALKLQNAGIIRYKRGLITVLDRKGLENRSCECYASVKKEQTRLHMLSLNS